MKAMPEKYRSIWRHMDFADAKGNFIRAARTGFDTKFLWMGKNISAEELLRKEFIPMAREGLLMNQVSRKEIDKYIGIIEERIESKQTGSRWIIQSYRKLKKNIRKEDAITALAAGMFKRQSSTKPIHTWKVMSTKEFNPNLTEKDFIYKIMTTSIFSVQEDDIIELISAIMQWKNIHHVPVENEQGYLVGLVTRDLLQKHAQEIKNGELVKAKDIMTKSLFTIDPEDIIGNVFNVMQKHELDCMPVVKSGKLVGIVTEVDFAPLMEKVEE